MKKFLIEWQGKKQRLADWSRETRISLKVLQARKRLRWSVERMLTETRSHLQRK